MESLSTFEFVYLPVRLPDKFANLTLQGYFISYLTWPIPEGLTITLKLNQFEAHSSLFKPFESKRFLRFETSKVHLQDISKSSLLIRSFSICFRLKQQPEMFFFSVHNLWKNLKMEKLFGV